MKVLTIEGFAGEEGVDGNVYEGAAWVFRFRIKSPAKFFRLQLPYLIETLGIDSRQIYELNLYGSPTVGLYDVRLYISFLDEEKPPSRSQVDALSNLLPDDFEPNDLLSNVETQLKELSPSVKQNLLKSLRRMTRDGR